MHTTHKKDRASADCTGIERVHAYESICSLSEPVSRSSEPSVSLPTLLDGLVDPVAVQHLSSTTNGVTRARGGRVRAGSVQDVCAVAAARGTVCAGLEAGRGGAKHLCWGCVHEQVERRRPHWVWAAGASPPPVNGDKQPCAGAQVAGAQSAGTQGARDGQKGQPGTGSPKALKRGWLGQPCATRGAFETWSICSSAPPS